MSLCDPFHPGDGELAGPFVTGPCGVKFIITPRIGPGSLFKFVARPAWTMRRSGRGGQMHHVMNV